MCKNPCSWNEISCSSSNSSMKGDPVQRAITGVIVFTYTHDKVSKKFYKGPASLKEMATQNATTHGPCRNNRDYIFLMEKALFEIGHEDDYIIELENEVRNVVGVLGHEMPNEKRILETTHSSLKVLASPRKLRPLPEAVAAIDSLLNQSEAKGNLMA